MIVLRRSAVVDPSKSTRRLSGLAHTCTALIAALALAVLVTFAAAVVLPETASAQVGPSGVECNNSGGSGGLPAGEHNVTIAGRDVLIYVGSGYTPSHPGILSFYLHGDGAGDRTFLTNQRRTLLDNNGWIYIAPRAFNDSWASGGVSSAASGNATIESNAQLLEDVFEALFADYNLCRNVLLGSSASGGSWFYDGYFLSTRGDQYPAYMNIACGSSGMDSTWAGFPFFDLLSFNTDPAILARTKLHYSIGTSDFLYPSAQKTIPYLQSVGLDVTTDIRPGVAHCAFDLDVAANSWWTGLCENGYIPVTSRDASGAVRPEACNAGQVTAVQCGDFADVLEGRYYCDAVEWAADNGVTTGTSTTTFSPHDTVTRAQLATFLWRYAGEPAGGPHSFVDVPDGRYYSEAVAWMAAQGITTGTTATTFSPHSPVTRAQMATFLWRYAGEPTGFSHPFTDVPSPSYFENGVAWMAHTGVTTGTSATTFSPLSPLTRGQAVTFLWRYNNLPR